MNWLLRAFEENSEPSFARVTVGCVVFVVLTLVVYQTLKDGKIPDLGGVTVFLTGAIATLYGTTRVASAFEKMSPPKDKDAKNG